MDQGTIKTRLAPGIAERTRDEGAILLRHGLYRVFELDPLSASIWRALARGDQFRGILRELTELYPDVGARALERDLRKFLLELEDNGLLLPEDGEANTSDAR
jgi:hypothetical protein